MKILELLTMLHGAYRTLHAPYLVTSFNLPDLSKPTEETYEWRLRTLHEMHLAWAFVVKSNNSFTCRKKMCREKWNSRIPSKQRSLCARAVWIKDPGRKSKFSRLHLQTSPTVNSTLRLNPGRVLVPYNSYIINVIDVGCSTPPALPSDLFYFPDATVPLRKSEFDGV